MTKEEYEISILKQLKNGLIDATRHTKYRVEEDLFGSKKWNQSKFAEFYLKELCHNFYNFEEPRISKLGTGCDAIRSSATMIFNVLGEDAISVNGFGDFPPVSLEMPRFEFPLRTITQNNRDGKRTDTTAKLDAALISNNKAIFIEAKLLEWLGSPKDLESAYLESSDVEVPKPFKELFLECINSEKKSSCGKYKHKYKRYDAIQMALHCLGVYNYCCEHMEIKTARLWNLVWSPSDKNKFYEEEEKDGLEFCEKANSYLSGEFEKQGVSFNTEYTEVRKFMEGITYYSEDGEKRKQYISKRYLFDRS